MANERFRFEPLGSHHDRAAFSCGVPELDRYLREQAGQDIRRRTATVFVLFDAQVERIAGYYTLSATAVEAGSLPDEVTRRLPRYRQLPAYLIGRLATDSRYRGQGFGELLLLDALHRCGAQTEIAGFAVIVDAKDDAARSFYERYAFRRLLDNPYRLFLPIRPTRMTPARGSE